ncbi:MAG: hypothetical protein IJQ63_08045 [Synergistaceae bacterium]|nr:hypothetical protein [Synergistaceae bacterium]
MPQNNLNSNLDPTTARVINELTVQLLPPLINELDEAVSSWLVQLDNKISNKFNNAIDSVRHADEIENSRRKTRDENLNKVLNNLNNLSQNLTQDLAVKIRNLIKAESAELKDDIKFETEQSSRRLEKILKDNNFNNNNKAVEVKALNNNISDELNNLITAAYSEILSLRQRLIKIEEVLEQKNKFNNNNLPQNVLDGLYSLSVQIGDFQEAQRDVKAYGQVINQLKSELDKNFKNLNLEKLDKLDDLKNFAGLEDKLNALANLEGLVRAQGHAQSRELEALSRELEAMQSQTGAAMIAAVQDASRQEAVERDAELEDKLDLEHEYIDTKLKTFAKILWLAVGFCGGAFILSLIKLFI